jgi:hypothetical protein
MCVAYFGGNVVVVAVSVSKMRGKDGGQDRAGLKDLAYSTCLGFSWQVLYQYVFPSLLVEGKSR